MAKHNETGLKGEQIAEDFLVKNGYFILERNWRHGHHEADLVCARDGQLIIVEVKTRKGTGYGFPEEAVTAGKKAFLAAAAQAYFDAHEGYSWVRFDVVSILLDRNDRLLELLHLPDAF